MEFKKLIQDIEKEGGQLLGKPDGLISNYAFKKPSNVLNTRSKLAKKYPEVDFYARGRRLLVYGIATT